MSDKIFLEHTKIEVKSVFILSSNYLPLLTPSSVVNCLFDHINMFGCIILMVPSSRFNNYYFDLAKTCWHKHLRTYIRIQYLPNIITMASMILKYLNVKLVWKLKAFTNGKTSSRPLHFHWPIAMKWSFHSSIYSITLCRSNESYIVQCSNESCFNLLVF